MANLSDFLPAAAAGGSTPSNTQFLIGTTSDQTATFSPTANNLEVGDKILVTLIGGGTGGTMLGWPGSGGSYSGLAGEPGDFWQGYYELTSTSDITMTAGLGGAGGTQSFTSNANFTTYGTAGNPSTLTQGGSVILSSDNSVTTSMMLPSWAGMTASGADHNTKFCFKNTDTVAMSGCGMSGARFHSPKNARPGSGSGGGGGAICTYNASGTISAGTGGSGLVIINW